MRFYLALLIFLVGCATTAPINQARDPEGQKVGGYSLMQLQSELGINRSTQDLGVVEKSFDSCKYSIKENGTRCGPRYLTVLHFQIVCRDSEGTVDNVVTNFKPLSSDHVEYQLAGGRGILRTDGGGYGQLQVVSTLPLHEQRLVITIGREFLGKQLSEVEQLVVPNYWCN
jgi:hypothetical protein